MKQAKILGKSGIWLLVAALIVPLFSLAAFSEEGAAAAANGDKIIVGYWHNFDNGSSNIRLRDVPSSYDVIQVAFAEPSGGAASGDMAFQPYNASIGEFQADVRELQSQGKKVLISIGGANGAVELSTDQAKQKFVSTMKSIIDTYGFDGLDIDLEGSSLSLNPGDTDFRNPTTPKIVNLISAVREIANSYGSGFVLTMAPETAYVQGGYAAYGGPWGAYLPVIYALRDSLDYLHVQHYNSGSMTGLDGNPMPRERRISRWLWPRCCCRDLTLAAMQTTIFPPCARIKCSSGFRRRSPRQMADIRLRPKCTKRWIISLRGNLLAEVIRCAIPKDIPASKG